MQSTASMVNGANVAQFVFDADGFGGLDSAGDTVAGWGGWLASTAFDVLRDDESLNTTETKVFRPWAGDADDRGHRRGCL